MADAYAPTGGDAAAKTLTDSVDEQKKALLTVLAEQGSAGRQAFEQAQQQIQAQKAAGLQAALNRSSQIGAPETFTQGAQAYAGQPFDTTLTGLSSARATFDADIARQTARDSSYFGKVAAAIPGQQLQTDAAMRKLFVDADQSSQERQQALTDSLLQRMAAQKQREFEIQQQRAAIEAAKIEADRDAQKFGWASEQHDWERSDAAAERDFRLQQEALQLAQDEAQLAGARASASARAGRSGGSGRTYAGQGMPLADLVHNLGGVGLAKAQLSPAAAQYVKDNAKKGSTIPTFAKGGTPGWGTFPTTKYVNTPGVSKAQALDQLGSILGLGPGELQKFLGKDSPDYTPPKKGPSAKKATEAQRRLSRSTNTYQEKAPNIVQHFKDITTGKGRLSVTQAKQQMITEIRTDKDYQNHPNVYEQLILDILAR